LPSTVILVDAPNAGDLAEELSQRLIGKEEVTGAFPATSFEHQAILDLPDITNENVDKIEADVEDWIKFKHSTLKKRRIQGKRQKLGLGISPEQAMDIVCIEIKR